MSTTLGEALAAPRPVMTKQRWVCLGLRRAGGGGALGVSFRPISGGGTLGKEMVYPLKKDTGRLAAGGVYEVEATEDGATARVAGATYLERWSDHDAVEMWHAAELAEKRAIRAEKDEAKLRSKHDFRCLEPIMLAYAKASPNGRIALEIEVINQLRTGLWRNRGK